MFPVSYAIVARAGALAFCAVALCACATTINKPAAPAAASAPAAKPPAANGAAPAGSAAARPGESPPPRPFADVIKDAKEIKGLFTLWQKDDKVWIEIRPEQLDQPFLFSTVLSRGIAQLPFVPGLMGDGNLASFHRIGNQVQLIARNTGFRTTDNSPLARAARASVSDSILASVAVASAPHAERKSFLIEANALLLHDIAGIGTVIDAAFRMGYALDARNSSIERVHSAADDTTIAVNLHYSVAKLPAPPVTPPPAGTPTPTPPRALADPRSFLLGVQYRFAALPAPPMPVRIADERVGYFVDEYRDLTREYTAEARVRVIDRWRLEKKDPTVALSEPKQPIVAYLDRNIPADLRPAVEAGVLEWNKAFEQAGFKNAIVVRQQPDDADWDTLEGRHIAVKWFIDSSLGGTAAIGPHTSDPRTGEILYASVLIPDIWARIFGQRFEEVLPPRVRGLQAELARVPIEQQCSYAYDALEQAGFSFELLVQRGEFARDSEAARRFILGSIKEVVMHEAGHALGLRHNFEASSAFKLDQLRNAQFTQSNGLSASIMDYVPENVPLDSEARVGQLQMDTIGAYDRWAIEWGYKQFDAAVERAELDRIAARSATDRALAYGTDEDAGGGGEAGTAATGLDPRTNRFDLGDDALAYYQREVRLVRELWTHTEQRKLEPDDDFRMYRRNLERGLRQMRGVAPNLAKYIGGLYVDRARAGAGRALLTPVEPARQRAALKTLTTELFAPASFRFDPYFMRRLGIDQFARDSAATRSPDFSLPAAVLDIQRPVLDLLMSDSLAQRLANAESKATDPRALLSFAEVQSTLTDAVWSELATGSDIGSLRRNLQREHLRRLAGALVKPLSTVAADVRAVQRQQAERLVARLQRALSAKGRRGAVAQAHLAESLATLREALAAPLYRTGV
ncbi:MAG: zinc-dependent metalloprotease [Gemmatimonadota bacterium]